MPVLESYIEQAACRMIKDLGVPSIKIKGVSGWPDRLFLLPQGKVVFVEFKRPGLKPRPKQVYIHNKLKKLGFTVEVCTNAREAYKLVAACLPEECS